MSVMSVRKSLNELDGWWVSSQGSIGVRYACMASPCGSELGA